MENIRRRINHELYELYDEVELVRRVKIQRLRCLGHVVRKDGQSPARRFSKLIHQVGLAGGENHLRFGETSWNMTSILLVHPTGARLKAEGAGSINYSIHVFIGY